MGTSNLELDQDSLNESLLKALVKEKEGHRAARLALDAAQAQITSLSNENKTLKASKILLEAVVQKHRIQPPGQEIRTPSTEERAQAAHKSILYDVLTEQRDTYEKKGYPEDNSIQDDRLFDLSLVSSNTQEDFELSIPERNVSHQFLVHKKDVSASSLRQDIGEVRQNLLIEVRPPTQMPTIKPNKPTVAEAVETCHQALKSVIGQAQEILEKPPILQLPVDFLAKYRATRKTPPVLQSQVENTSSAVTLPPEEFRTEEAQISPIKSGTVTNGVPQKPLPVLDTKIRWAMSSLVPAFDNEDEIEQAKQNFLQSDRSRYPTSKPGNHASYFWQHPVRFLPNPTEKNLYRTVMIDYIPRGTAYQDVTAHVRTGALESIQLFPPVRGSTDYFTARVVFNYEIPAVSTVMHYQKRMSRGDPIKIKGSPVRFWQVLQPTYPANKQLETDIFQNGYTRILLLENVENSGVLPKLHEKLVPELRDGTVIRINRTADGRYQCTVGVRGESH